jgi:uncharacterized protein YfiM (DUF2279 family)
MPRARDYASLLLAAFAAVLLTKNAEGAEAPPLELEAKIALGDVRGRIVTWRSIWNGTGCSSRDVFWAGRTDLAGQRQALLRYRVRHALTNGHDVNEARAGVTFAVPLRFEGAHNR